MRSSTLISWSNWVNDIARVTEEINAHIRELNEHNAEATQEFEKFLGGLHKCINDTITPDDAIEFLSQHIVSAPVYDALFKDHHIAQNNPVSRAMDAMVVFLKLHGLEKHIQSDKYQRFYENVRNNVSELSVDFNKKQTIINDLYGSFFSQVFPKTVAKLGIVYTPIECVDFMINSVDELMHKYFGYGLTQVGVNILDPFVGTGTFVSQLLNNQRILDKDIKRKYLKELHCNEIVPLAYYIASVNIENTFNTRSGSHEFLPYNNIVLTDTFQSTNVHNRIQTPYLQDNVKAIQTQESIPIQVIIGNPPYSRMQNNANDNAQNLKYKELDTRILETYAKETKANLKNALYDSYVRAIRWASDRIDKEKGGMVAFIANKGWINKGAMNGLRACLEKEFDAIYIYDLRGDINARILGGGKGEGENIFGQGSKTPIAITFFIKREANSTPKHENAEIYYYAVPDNQTREEKIEGLLEFNSILDPKLPLCQLQPDEHHDWLAQRNNTYSAFTALKCEKKFTGNAQKAWFDGHLLGVSTNRDAWVYNSSLEELSNNVLRHIHNFNQEIDRYQFALSHDSSVNIDDFKNKDSSYIKWTALLTKSLQKQENLCFESHRFFESVYRPFMKQHFYFGKKMIERPGKNPKLWSTPNTHNRIIAVSGIGCRTDFSCLMVNSITDIQLLPNGQCFPLYWYDVEKHPKPKKHKNTSIDKEKDRAEKTLDSVRKDGITDWALQQTYKRYGLEMDKEDLFYYIYGVLHAPNYRKLFSNDLKKMLPRIPFVNSQEDFCFFCRIGKKLGDLHVHYESCPASRDVLVVGDSFCQQHGINPENLKQLSQGNTVFKEACQFYAVHKMKFNPKTRVLIYNEHIRIEKVPAETDQYVIGGYSALGWVVKQYLVSTDKYSGILNDPNAWSREHGNPRYILELVLSIIELSVRTVALIGELPEFSVEV